MPNGTQCLAQRKVSRVSQVRLPYTTLVVHLAQTDRGSNQLHIIDKPECTFQPTPFNVPSGSGHADYSVAPNLSAPGERGLRGGHLRAMYGGSAA